MLNGDVDVRAYGSGNSKPMHFIPNLRKLISLTNDELSRIDLGLVNLCCAAGLPGGEHIDFAKCLQALDEWARVVAAETENWRPNFRPNPSCPTEARYRSYMLVKVLRDGFNLKHYLLPKKGTGIHGIRNGDGDGIPARFDDAKLLFIHGLLSDERIGSCSSLPVLYAAVGRRLAYPIRLVTAVQHVFIRWEDEHEVFNTEGSGPYFINTHPNEHYVDTPRPWTDEEKTCGALLSSLTPRQELAAFLYMRYACLLAHRRWYDCRAVMRAVCNLHPEHPHYRQSLNLIEDQIAYEAVLNPVNTRRSCPRTNGTE